MHNRCCPQVGILVDGGLGGGDFLVYIDFSATGKTVNVSVRSTEEANLFFNIHIFFAEDGIVTVVFRVLS